MSTSSTTAISRYDCAEDSTRETVETFVNTVSDALADAGASEGVVESVEDIGQDVVEEVGNLREELAETKAAVDEQPEVEVEDDGDPLGSLTVEGAPLGRALKSKPSETDVKGMIEDTTPTPNGDETTIQEPDVTPIERLSRADDVSDVTDSISVERAVSLFRNVTDWGRKTPKGYTLRPKDRPKELLESARDETLNWKQYYRACRALERLSEGAITFVKTERHGNTVVFHEQSDVFSRRTERLSAATAGTAT